MSAENRSILIEKQKIGAEHPPFIIAEMSGNHNQSLDRALAIVDAATKSGAHAIKLQTYTPDTMTLDINEGEFRIDDPNSPWYGRSLYDLYQEAHTPWHWIETIFARCEELGIICFSSVFDATSVDFLEGLGTPAYKIASFENVDIPLIQKAASTGKPLIISTGMATLAELDDAVRAARGAGCKNLILLKCTSSYPASPKDSNVRSIPHLADLFNVQVGISDHTLGIGAAVASTALGATVIEKHLTLNRTQGGVDSAFSLEPTEFATLVQEATRAWSSLGAINYEPSQAEIRSKRLRRSLYVVADMEPGDIFTLQNVRAIRPGYGLHTGFLEHVLGRTAKEAVAAGTPLTWELLT